MDSLRELYPDLLLVDGGDVGLTTRKNAVWQIPILYEAMAAMGYDVIGIGERDADSTTFGWIAKYKSNKPTFLGGNLAKAKDITGQIAVFERNGLKIGVAAAVSEKVIMRNPFFTAEPIEAYLDAVAKQLDAEKVDFKVLLYHGDIYRARALSQKRKEFDLIFVGHSNGRPMSSEFYPDAVPIVGPGDRGRELALVTLRKTSAGLTRVDCDIIPLDDKVASSPKATPYVQKNRETAIQRAKAASNGRR